MSTELEVNRSLINIRFNSYRFLSDVPWIIESHLFTSDYGQLQTLELGQNDYSYVHVSMATNINNLCQDPSLPLNVYFVTRNGVVVVGSYIHKDENKLKLISLFQILDYDSQNTYASLTFVSSSRALILRSKRFETENKFSLDLLIINRVFDNEIETWNLENIFTIPTESLYSDFELEQSSHMHLLNTGFSSDCSITFVFGCINKLKTSESKDDKTFKNRFCTVLHWLTLENDLNSNNWILKTYRKLVENGSKSDWPKYVEIHCEDISKAIIIVVTEGRMKFFNIIENGIRIPTIPNSNELKSSDKFIKPNNLNQQNFVNTDEESSNFNMELEECDLQDFYDSLTMTIFNGNNGDILTEYDLTSHQWICSISNSKRLLPFFAMRYDVDAFIYEFNEHLQAKHIAVFDALGYIQASKTKKRFMTICKNCKNEWSHAVIADSEQNLYVYWKTNRSIEYGNHRIVRIDHHSDQCSSIQGLSASVVDQSPSIFVLTNDRLFLIRFKEDESQ